MKAKQPITPNGTPLLRKKDPISPPKIKDVIGASLKHVSNYKNLDNTKQVVALINDVSRNFIYSSITFFENFIQPILFFAPGHVYQLWKMLYDL